MGVARLGLLVAVACSSGKPKQVEDARRVQDAAGATAAPIDAATSDPIPKAPTTGDVQVRVEWPTMPLAARVSPGWSACGTPLLAQVAPTTTWGIPEVVVFVEGAPAASSEARIAIDHCAVTPRLAIGARVAIASAADQPITAAIARQYTSDLAAVTAAPIAIALPIAGHEVSTEIDDAIHRIAPQGKDAGEGHVVGATAFITDATGVALVKDVPSGTHAVRVWLPPRGGQRARSATGEVTVAAGDLAEITLTLE